MNLCPRAFALIAAAIALGPAAQAGGGPLDLAYRADQPAFHMPEAAAGTQLPRLLEDYAPPPPPAAPEPASATPLLYVWDRVRAGFTLPEIDGPPVAYWQAWYLNRPQLLQTMFARSRRYVYHVIEELDKRNMPTELTFLPMVESGYDPMALSSAQALGLWQFIPSTGKEYKLVQGPFYDARRDVIASTSAALDYLQSLFEQFGDWRLALAAYNAGEAAVNRAIERNKARGLPTGYQALALPEETRNYLPKLQALKNIVANPGAFRIEIERVPNRPYFATVASSHDLDAGVAARLAEFLALNPAHQPPMIAGGVPAQLVLPVEKVESFENNLENYNKSIERKLRAKRKARATYAVKSGDTLATVAAGLGVTAGELKAWNPWAEDGIRFGQTLEVHRK
jgi:membrane-bound lytic murein transglycosylase D